MDLASLTSSRTALGRFRSRDRWAASEKARVPGPKVTALVAAWYAEVVRPPTEPNVRTGVVEVPPESAAALEYCPFRALPEGFVGQVCQFFHLCRGIRETRGGIRSILAHWESPLALQPFHSRSICACHRPEQSYMTVPLASAMRQKPLFKLNLKAFSRIGGVKVSHTEYGK